MAKKTAIKWPEKYQKQIDEAAKPKVVTPVPVVKRPGKTGRIKVSAAVDRTVDGIVFDSKLEAKLYLELVAWIGKDAFSLQPKFCLQPGFVDYQGKKQREIAYSADFLIGPPWVEGTPLTEQHLVVDVKGWKTELYRLKKKMFLFQQQRPILEVKKSSELLQLLLDHGIAVNKKP